MTTEQIDRAIEHYLQLRRCEGKASAEAHFVTYAFTTCGREGPTDFLKHIRGLASYYIDYLRVFGNPLRGPEPYGLMLVLLLALFGCWLLADDDSRIVGIFVVSGSLVNGCSLGRLILTTWRESGVTIAIYRELIALVDGLLQDENASTC